MLVLGTNLLKWRDVAMADPNSMLKLESFGQLKEAFATEFKLPVEMIDLAGVPTAGQEQRPPLCALLCKGNAGRSCCHADHRRAIELSFEYGEAYSFVCHAGLLATCTPLADQDKQIGALLSGMTLPENPGDAMVEEVRQRLSIFGLAPADVRKAVEAHRFVEGTQLQKSSKRLSELSRKFLSLDSRLLDACRERTQQLARIAERIHAVKSNPDPEISAYPYEREKELIEKVKLGDRHGAKGVLNDILGTVLFRDPMGSAVLKTRLVELLAVLSRAAAEAGVDSGQVLKQNLTYFDELLSSNSDTDLCVVVSRALNNFLDTVCIKSSERINSPVTNVVQYIETHYMNDLTVEELAHHAHLSPSRLAHLFQEQMGTTMTGVLTHVRIEQAKKLLLRTNLSCTEIAFRVGYKDQSYFTRIFRKQEEVTPRRFRALNRMPISVTTTEVS
jgi:AraC-like DNA-binding protein/ligand-binding sensor protein